MRHAVGEAEGTAARTGRGRGRSFVPALLLLLPATSLSARQVATGATDVPDADSAALHQRAVDAQRRFEDTRRERLPLNTRWSGGPCDDVVGRLCWRQDMGDERVPRGEDWGVWSGRTALVSELTEIGGLLPGDDWILGQRVWYLLDAEQMGPAVALARDCGGASPWWCAALAGLALHVGGYYDEAARAFDRAIGAMDPATKARWDELRRGDDDVDLPGAGSADEGTAERWRLADPLWLVPGNDRLTEQLARRVAALVESDAANPQGLPWGDDLAELVVRYGWPVGYERVNPLPGELGGVVDVVAYRRADLRSFLPPSSVVADPTAAATSPWAPSPGYAAVGYTPAYAPVFLPMASRIVTLTRGDSSLVAATFSLPADTTFRTREGLRLVHRPPAAFEGAPLESGLFLADARGEIVREDRKEGAPSGVLRVMAPAGSYQASVEVLEPTAGWAGRLRNGHPVARVAPDAAVLSELLVLDEGPPPETVEEALDRLRLVEEARPEESLPVGWELWGLGWREEVLSYRLSLEPVGGGLIRGVGRLLGLGERTAVVLEWEEPGPTRPGAWFRSASLQLPDLDEGEYLLRLEVTAPGRAALTSERTIRVVAPERGGGGEPR